MLYFFIYAIIKLGKNGEGYMQQIWVAIVSGLCVAIPSVIATISSNKRNNDLVIYRIEELDKKVHEHNNLIDRMYTAEESIKVIQEKISH